MCQTPVCSFGCETYRENLCCAGFVGTYQEVSSSLTFLTPFIGVNLTSQPSIPDPSCASGLEQELHLRSVSDSEEGWIV